MNDAYTPDWDRIAALNDRYFDAIEDHDLDHDGEAYASEGQDEENEDHED